MIKELAPGDPRLIGPYRLVGQLGSGGMGRVYLGLSPGGRSVAVKVIRTELAADPHFRVRFRREVAAARRVSGMFTAVVVDADIDSAQPWLATAYVSGPSLGEAVRAYGPLPIDSALTLAAGLAEGLAAIHAAGVAHRDLKPSNVLLAEDGPRVIDFGISRAPELTSVTTAGSVFGSPGFMSPEQAEGGQAGQPSDIFSLGAVLVYAATGQSPFGNGTTPALLYRVVHGMASFDGVPDQIRVLAERCLVKDPDQRPTAAQLLAQVGPVQPMSGWLPTVVLGQKAQAPDGSRLDEASASAAPAAAAAAAAAEEADTADVTPGQADVPPESHADVAPAPACAVPGPADMAAGLAGVAAGLEALTPEPTEFPSRSTSITPEPAGPTSELMGVTPEATRVRSEPAGFAAGPTGPVAGATGAPPGLTGLAAGAVAGPGSATAWPDRVVNVPPPPPGFDPAQYGRAADAFRPPPAGPPPAQLADLIPGLRSGPAREAPGLPAAYVRPREQPPPGARPDIGPPPGGIPVRGRRSRHPLIIGTAAALAVVAGVATWLATDGSVKASGPPAGLHSTSLSPSATPAPSPSVSQSPSPSAPVSSHQVAAKRSVRRQSASHAATTSPPTTSPVSTPPATHPVVKQTQHASPKPSQSHSTTLSVSVSGTRLSCGDAGSLRSSDGSAAELTITNNSSVTVDIDQITSDGSVSGYATVTAGGILTVSTFTGDYWMIAAPGGGCLTIVDITSNTQVTVN